MRSATTVSRRLDGRLGSWHGISFADLAILLELSRAPAARLRRVDLAGRLGLTASAVTRALIPLEKIGLVSRKADPNDARVGYATITAAGRRVLDEAVESAEVMVQEIVRDEGGRMDGCIRLLDRLAAGESSSPNGA
jgi:DNA-binding MarR family transcriptional regulator